MAAQIGLQSLQGSPQVRLFAGLPLPPAAVERLATLRLRLGAPKDGLRWSEPEQWHITLRFFGEVDERRLPALASALERIATPPIAMVLTSLGLFAAKGILHAEVGVSPALDALFRQVESVATHLGIAPETRAFHPHVTLARSRGKTGAASLRRLCTPSIPSFGPELHWLAKELLLYRSDLQPTGAVYQVLGRYPLQ